MKSKRLDGTAQGQAGVYRVASELILRGHVPFFPAVDNAGVDLIVDGTVRLQIKTTMRALPEKKYSGRTWKEGRIQFSLSRRIYDKGRIRTTSRHYSSQCDLVVLWAIEPNRFWIVPSRVLDGRCSFNLAEKQQIIEFDTQKAMSLRVQGWSFRAIGELLGVDGHTVCRRLHRSGGDMHIKRAQPSLEFRKSEGRWDLISEYVNLSREANRLAETPRSTSEAIVNREAFLKA